MDPKELFASVITETRPCITAVHNDELQNRTPCSEWDLRALLNHLVYELLWIPELLNGKTVEEVGGRFEGDVVGSDPVNAWHTASTEAQAAVERADMESMVHLSRGDVTADQYIKEVANDVLIHGWDVAQSINCSLIFEPRTTQVVYDFIKENVAGYRQSGMFGDEVPVPADAALQTKLLALEGRRERP